MPNNECYALSQSGKTPVRTETIGEWLVRAGYARAEELRVNDADGQDYVTSGVSNGRLAFCLCDGVSQAFYGDLAARILGQHLIRWLLSHEWPDESAFVRDLSSCLTACTEEATRQVRALVLPDNLVPLHREVLERKREEGGQSTFVCALLEPPDEANPQGRASLAWLGDSRLRIWDREGVERIDLSGERHTMERWSTLTGPVRGQPHVRILPLDRIGCLAAYSDGLAALDGWDRLPDNARLQELVDATAESPTSDDVSFVAVELVEDLWPEQPEREPTTRRTSAEGRSPATSRAPSSTGVRVFFGVLLVLSLVAAIVWGLPRLTGRDSLFAPATSDVTPVEQPTALVVESLVAPPPTTVPPTVAPTVPPTVPPTMTKGAPTGWATGEQSTGGATVPRRTAEASPVPSP